MNSYQAGRQAARKIVLWQAISAVLVGLGFLAFSGIPAGVWAGAGGLIGAGASLIMVNIAFGKGQALSAAEVSRKMFQGELAKFVFTVSAFIAVFVLAAPLPMPLFVGYVVTFLVYWLALARAA